MRIKGRFFSVIAILCSMSLIGGCGAVKKTYAAETKVIKPVTEVKNANPTAKITNPMISYDSAEAIDEKMGVLLKLPEKTQTKSFYIIGDEIAECQFYVGEHKYCLRAYRNSGNFTGVYDVEIPHELVATLDGVAESFGEYQRGGRYSKWTKDDVHYSLITLMDVEENEFVDTLCSCVGRVE